MNYLRLFCAVWFMFAAFPVAAEWRLVVSDQDRKIEIDFESIINSDGGTKVAWSRMRLVGAAAKQVDYAMVKALNRYDCFNRNFTTLRRVYLDPVGKVLREEVVNDPTPVLVMRNSVDERMWNEVCKPLNASVKDLAGVVKAADAAATKVKINSISVKKDQKKDNKSSPVPSAKQSKVEPKTIESVKVEAVLPGSQKNEPVLSVQKSKKVKPFAKTTPVVATPVSPSAAEDRMRPSKAKDIHQVAEAFPVTGYATGVDWQYTGENGPQNWGVLKPEWAICNNGVRQAPVDLTDAIKVDLEPVRFDYRPTRLRIVDTGKLLQAFPEQGMGVTIRGQYYILDSLWFHRPSEGQIGTKAADMSIELLHQADHGEKAIVSILLNQGAEPNELLQDVLNNLPLEKGEAYLPATTVSMGAILPADPGHYLYVGSLPFPPCTEGVTWVVMQQPMSVSADQLAILDRLYPHSARPVQPAHGRLILESR